MRYFMLILVLLGACEDPGLAAPASGPIDIYAQELVKQGGSDNSWLQSPDIRTQRKAAELLNGLAQSPSCFNVIPRAWEDGEEPPAGVVDSRADDSQFRDRDLTDVLGFANVTAPGGGRIYTLAATRTSVTVVAHEVLHIALGEDYPHDENPRSFFAEAIDESNEMLEPTTIQALQEFCP